MFLSIGIWSLVMYVTLFLMLMFLIDRTVGKIVRASRGIVNQLPCHWRWKIPTGEVETRKDEGQEFEQQEFLAFLLLSWPFFFPLQGSYLPCCAS